MVLRRLASLRARHAARTLDVRGRAGPLGPGGPVLTQLRAARGRIEVTGLAAPGTIALEHGMLSAAAHVAGTDDADRGGEGGRPGPFSLSLPMQAGVRLDRAVLRAGDATWPLPWIGLSRRTLRADVAFLTTAAGLAPEALRWLRHRDPASKARIKRALRLDAIGAPRDLPSGLFADGRVAAAAGGPVTIVVPIFDAHDLLSDCLDRVVRHTRGDWHLILVDDASPDPRIADLLDRTARAWPARTTCHRLPRNLGFVGAANAGLELARGDGRTGPIVLLNSDAMVPPDWDRRLTAPLRDGDPDVASVTPLSNDAEILGVPTVSTPRPLPPGAGDRIDAVAATLGARAVRAVLPTGVGFCMAMSRGWLDRLPAFDAAFGRGYGEEVDWCQKVRAAGGRHLAVGDLFVEHRGGGSFGAAAKAALVARNGARISRRYPAYDLEVQRFIAADPLAGPRLVLGLAWAAETARTIPIYVAHWLGGGAEHWLEERIAGDIAQTGAAVVLRVGGPRAWSVELHATGRDGPDRVAGQTDDAALVERLLAVLPHDRRRMTYSNAVGAADLATLPARLRALAGPHGVEVALHDYLPLSERLVLIDPDGRYRGPRAGEDPGDWSGPAGTDPAAWRALWAPVLDDAPAIVAFSDESARLAGLLRPDLADRIAVRPHAVPHLDPAPPVPRGAPPVVASLGNLAPHKGADVMARLSRRWAAEMPGATLMHLGNLDPASALARGCRVHGDYRRADLPRLVARYGITHWIIPSIWPETFSYTTHEALRTGRPVLAFDIGAQGVAVGRAPNGLAVPWAAEADPVDLLLDALRGLLDVR